MLYGFHVWLSPLLASFSGFTASTIITLIVTGKWIIKGSLKSALYNTGLPTYAAASISRNSTTYPRLMHIAWPLAAFGLFALKVGFTAHLWLASYWLIVPALYVSFRALHSQLLFRSLTASLIAHSVGSLIVLYFDAPVVWSSLVAIVPLERITCMVGMLICDRMLHRIQWLYRKINNHLIEKTYGTVDPTN